MRALVIVFAVSVLLELCSSALRKPVINDDKRNTRQLILGLSPLSPLNPFYTPLFNRTSYGHGLLPTLPVSSYSSHFNGPATFHLSSREGVTVIPNAEPLPASYQTSQGHLNAQVHPSSQGISNQLANSQMQTRVQAQLQQKRLQLQQAQYQQQLQQAAQNVQPLPEARQTAQPLYYPQADPLSYQGFYSTPAPTVFPSPLYDIPAQQFPSLIDQGYFKYPVYIDPNLANTVDGMDKPMFMKKRTLQDLCAAYAPEEKTVIYVLSQNPSEPPEEIEVPKVPQPTKPSKPEVYFVKYNTPEEADLAQKHIQAQYDALGGTSELSNEGISPIATAQEILSGAHNLTRKFPLVNNNLRQH